MTSYRAVCDERSRFEALLSTADASKAQVFQRGCFVCVCGARKTAPTLTTTSALRKTTASEHR